MTVLGRSRRLAYKPRGGPPSGHRICAWKQSSDHVKRRGMLEARVRIELTHRGFADLSLTTWVPRLIRPAL